MKRLQHLLAVCLICRPAALQRWGWKVKGKKRKKEEEAESGPGERKMWVSWKNKMFRMMPG